MRTKDTTVDVLPDRLSEALFEAASVQLATIVRLNDEGVPQVQVDPTQPAVNARLAVAATREKIAVAIAECQQAVVLFENGDRGRPIILGFIEALQPSPAVSDPPSAAPVVEADVDGKRVRVTAQDEIVLQCGSASVTLRRNGRVIIRGTYVESRSDGTNRIKGGQVQIN
jgi:hypothetical protein